MNKPDKGEFNGSCNRTACQKPGATWYNLSTRAYYCAECAALINWPGGRADTKRLFGVELLCTEQKVARDLRRLTLMTVDHTPFSLVVAEYFKPSLRLDVIMQHQEKMDELKPGAAIEVMINGVVRQCAFLSYKPAPDAVAEGLVHVGPLLLTEKK